MPEGKLRESKKLQLRRLVPTSKESLRLRLVLLRRGIGQAECKIGQAEISQAEIRQAEISQGECKVGQADSKSATLASKSV